MENKPTTADFLAQEIGLISANKRNQELEQELAQYKGKEVQ